MAKTKIIVLHLKEIIYTVIFAILGILLILLLIFMFSGKDSNDTDTSDNITYKPGVYTQSLQIGENVLNLEVVVNERQIDDIRIVNLDDSITTMYPLVEPSLESLEAQLCSGIPVEEVSLAEDSKFTQTVLLDAIELAITKAIVE